MAYAWGYRRSKAYCWYPAKGETHKVYIYIYIYIYMFLEGTLVSPDSWLVPFWGYPIFYPLPFWFQSVPEPGPTSAAGPSVRVGPGRQRCAGADAVGAIAIASASASSCAGEGDGSNESGGARVGFLGPQ